MLFGVVQFEVGVLQLGEFNMRVGFDELLDEQHDGEQFIGFCDLFHSFCQFDHIQLLFVDRHCAEFLHLDGQGIVVEHSVDEVLGPFVQVEVVDEVEQSFHGLLI